MSFGSSKLAGTLVGQREQLASCVKLLLLWVAASDGTIDASELEFAASQFPESEGAVATNDLLAAIRNTDLGEIERAVRAVAAESRELRTAFLDLAITMSMADRQIAITENHILRFYADALYLGTPILEKRFQAISGGPLAEPGDPGSPAWWEQALKNGFEIDPAAEASDRERFEPQAQQPAMAPRMTLSQAREVLGVGSSATQPEIEYAYENLAAIFDVDRVAAMGEAAVSVANKRLKKIQEAYQLLRG